MRLLKDLHLDATDFLEKPFEPEVIIGTMPKALDFAVASTA
jgi:FixJ family two-component response regulator